jgi:hypothetical protein
MEEITLQVQRDEQSGWLAAWWDDPGGAGGITTQGQDLRDLQEQITDAVGLILSRAPLPAGFGSISSVIQFWFRREVAAGRLGGRRNQGVGASRLLDYQTCRISRSNS